MNRRIFLLGVAGAAAGCLRSGRRLNVYNWENYVASSTIPDFEREFQCRVRYATYGSAEEMLAKVMSREFWLGCRFPVEQLYQPMCDLELLCAARPRAPPGLRILKPVSVASMGPEVGVVCSLHA